MAAENILTEPRLHLDHTMSLQNYTLKKMALPSIDFQHLMVCKM